MSFPYTTLLRYVGVVRTRVVRDSKRLDPDRRTPFTVQYTPFVHVHRPDRDISFVRKGSRQHLARVRPP